MASSLRGVEHLDDDHAIQQGLVFLFLQELVELREIGMRDDGFIEINQQEARN
jgi:hypothetical protein